MKNGLKDKKNKSLLRNYINLAAKFAEVSGGKDFFNNGKVLIQHLLSSLSDKQPLLRCDILNALHKFEKTLGGEFILNHTAIFLQGQENRDSQSVEMKQEILNWLLKNSGLLAKFPNLKSLMHIFFTMLLDKNKDIRLLTDQLLEKLYQYQGLHPIFSEALKSFKPAAIQQIKLFLEKYTIEKKEEKIQIPSEILCEKNPKTEKKPDSKEDRLTEIWPLDCLNDDLIEKLKENISQRFGQEISKKLFSFDWKKISEGILLIQNHTLPQEILANSDLISKWIWFKLMNFVPESLFADLLFLMKYLTALIAEKQYKLGEEEGKVFLECLMKSRAGNINGKYDVLIDTITRSLISILPQNQMNFTAQVIFPEPSYIERAPMENFQNSSNNKLKNKRYSSINNSSFIMNESLTTPEQHQRANLNNRNILQNNLLALNLSNIPGKIDALFNIHNIFHEESNEENQKIIQEEANNIAKTVSDLFRPDTEALANSSEFLNYLLKISLKIFSNKRLLDHIEYPILTELVENVLQRLLVEDAKKLDPKQIQPSDTNDMPIKNLNSLMLKLLETCYPNTMFQILFDLLIRYRRQSSYTKFLGLVVKSILKLTKAMEIVLPNTNISELFLKFHVYVSEFYNDNSKNKDDLGVKTIKTLINEIIKIKELAF